MHIAEGLHSQLSKFKELFDEISDRMDVLESRAGDTGKVETETVVDAATNEAVEELSERIAALESLPKARAGRDGRDGDDGRDGRPGKDAKEFGLGDLKDVDTTGITDRALVEWSAEKESFIVYLDVLDE